MKYYMSQKDSSYKKIPRKMFLKAVASILLEQGKTIPMIESVRSRTYPGDSSQERYHDSPVWHNKRDLDRVVVKWFNLDYDSLLGPKRRSSDFSRHLSNIISTLRRNGVIKDWNENRHFGIWRVVDSETLSEYVASKSVTEVKPAHTGPVLGLNHAFLTILERGRKDNTYKFALARALLDYCQDHADASADALSIPYEYFADKFLRYYYHQEFKFRMRQNFRPNVPPRAINILRKVFGDAPPGDIDLVDKDTLDQARRRILADIFGHARRKTSLVIPRFQKISVGLHGKDTRAFYEYDDDTQILTLKPDAFEFLKSNYPVLSKAVLAEWAKFLEKVNPSLPMLVAKIEDHEAKRGSLVKYRNIYMEHTCHCFYCRCHLERKRIHVDHLIPWSYLFDDNAWNLVLACQDCNLKKSSSLPQEEFRGSLIERNMKYYDTIPAMKLSLDQLNSGRGWVPEIVTQYERCAEYGFGIVSMP